MTCVFEVKLATTTENCHANARLGPNHTFWGGVFVDFSLNKSNIQ